MIFARDGGLVDIPDGRIACIGAPAGDPGIPTDRLVIETSDAVAESFWREAGAVVVGSVDGTVAAALVTLPRSRVFARMLVARAARAVGVGGRIFVDGRKTDGIEALRRDLMARGTAPDAFSKAHGKLLWFSAPEDMLSIWAEPDHAGPDGFKTVPGIFSADGVDPGSEFLARNLPALKGRVADLGSGWGYLARGILASEGVTRLDLVEADGRALDCARANVDDARAVFHRADARTWGDEGTRDVVVMNPPFHEGRAVEPELGVAFMRNAARLLTAGGRLWLVAGRRLPYEAPLRGIFGKVELVDAARGYKVIRAGKPLRP